MSRHQSIYICLTYNPVLLSTCGQLFIVLLFISRRLQTQLEAFKTAEAASGKQTKVFVVLFSLFEFFFLISEGNLKREI